MWEIFESVGRKRGFLISGGEIDYDRTANVILDEFRSGKLGPITLEKSPSSAKHLKTCAAKIKNNSVTIP